MSKTGYALGNLSPIMYFRNAKGHLVLAAYDAGKPEQAIRVFKARFEPQGYELCETRNLNDVIKLEKELTEQAERERATGMHRMLQSRAAVQRVISDNLRQRMVSSACSPFEREFIQLMFARQENRDKKYIEQFEHHAMYLNVLQNDTNKQFQDFSPDQPGDFWRGEAQQK